MTHWTIKDDPDVGIAEMREQVAELHKGYEELEATLDKLARISAEMRALMRPPPEEVATDG